MSFGVYRPQMGVASGMRVLCSDQTLQEWPFFWAMEDLKIYLLLNDGDFPAGHVSLVGGKLGDDSWM